MDHWSYHLPYRACDDALAWLSTQPDAETAWATCQRGDWMLYHAGKLSGPPGSDSRRPLVLAACACARLALPYVKEDEQRPRIAIETAEAWARGGPDAPTLDQVRDAAYAAAAYAAYAANAAYAADAAAAAAANAAYAADADAAAAAAANAADADADVYARTKIRAQCADLVRGFYPVVPLGDHK